MSRLISVDKPCRISAVVPSSSLAQPYWLGKTDIFINVEEHAAAFVWYIECVFSSKEINLNYRQSEHLIERTSRENGSLNKRPTDLLFQKRSREIMV